MKVPLYLRGLLLLTLLGCAWLFWQGEDANVDAPLMSVVKVKKTAVPLHEPEFLTEPSPVVDLFPVQTWMPPPPVPRDTRAPTATPPPLPFTVSAQWRYQNQQKIVILRGNGNQFTLCNQCNVPGRIKPGDLLGNDYRLDKLTDTSVVLTYLPMKHVSTLHLDAH